VGKNEFSGIMKISDKIREMAENYRGDNIILDITFPLLAQFISIEIGY